MKNRCGMLVSAVAFFLVAIFLSYALPSSGDGLISSDKNKNFAHFVVDAQGPRDPWGKSVGDINGDGLVDLIVGGSRPRERTLLEKIKARLRIGQGPLAELVWYENPSWVKHIIATGSGFSTDHEVVDLDGDGRNDVVSLTKDQLVWFRNPDWTLRIIDRNVLHDIEVRDIDLDGSLDIVARNQSAFGGDGSRVFIYSIVSPDRWERHVLTCPDGEGLKVADINRDGYADIIVNGSWFENRGDHTVRSWVEHRYADAWIWPHTTIDVGDINKDGRYDIILAPAEKAGGVYRLSWFEAPGDVRLIWKEHVVEDKVETVHHFVGAVDMDCDGQVDIVTAEMHHGKDPDEITVYLNQQSGKAWRREVIGIKGSHNMRIVDVDNDGDPDLFGANWSGNYQPVELWENQTYLKTSGRWIRHVIDSCRPGRAVFIIPADLDDDGYKDIVTGAWWYRNPGHANGTWHRRNIGETANNVAVVKDFDSDGDPDLLASMWGDHQKLRLYQRVLRKLGIIGYETHPTNGRFVWARNDGAGNFKILENIAKAEGDFLQGAVAGSFDGAEAIALSWHQPGYGVQMLYVPDDLEKKQWNWRRISNISQDECLSAGDIDGDGDTDLVLGTQWLRSDGADEWSPFTLWVTSENPDRNRVVDINGDGKLDVIIGYEAISVTGKVAWYSQNNDPTRAWIEHPIASVVGPMSLDVADIDKDGDQDVIVGEHNLKEPETARLLVFENLDGTALRWRTHVIYTGDEHHDGARVVDIDNDGDLDIISIGWSHNRVLLYENRSDTDRCWD